MSSQPPRPEFIRHWTALEGSDNEHYPNSDEKLSIRAPLARKLGLKQIGIHHERLLPGRRTSYPHAESLEEEFVFVLSGEPDAWIDGHLHRLSAGDAVGFPAGTGLCHTFLNNTEEEVRLLVVGEAAKAENKVYYPCNPEQQAIRTDWWHDVPHRTMGPHHGKPGERTTGPTLTEHRPDCILNFRDHEGAPDRPYDGAEPMRIDVDFSTRFGLTRIGIHHQRLPPGHRSCYPHAESREEEFVFILEGEADAWIDGWLYRVKEGDAIAFPAGTGIAHNLINNGAADMRMMVIGQRNVPGNRLFYPRHVEHSARWGDDWWHDAPQRPLGPHDGRPSARS
ncbi:MAG: cupin domain-containing protein [Dongiaceae bacterium]